MDSVEGTVGRAVMLYANKDGKKMVVCCNEKHEIHPVEMVSVNKWLTVIYSVWYEGPVWFSVIKANNHIEIRFM